jgi:xanthine dehydrogenase large subunit
VSAEPPAQSAAGPVLGRSVTHESAALHVTGAALFTDDLAGRLSGLLHAWPVRSPHAHARVAGLRTEPALAVPGVVRVLTGTDVPGDGMGGEGGEEALFPSEVMFHGHAVCWVLAESLEAARLGAGAVVVDYAPLPSLVTIREAIESGSFQGRQPTMSRGDLDEGFTTAAHVFRGETESGGQEHFYLETQASLALVDESGQVLVHSSTQHPTETQEVVARVLGRPRNAVAVQCVRMGGGFGGKESQSHAFAAIAALGVVLTGRPVRVRLPRSLDVVMTGKRHPFLAQWRVGFDADGHLLALDVTLTSDGGWSLDLSEPVLARAMCHVDNAYWIPHVTIRGRIARTHKTTQTAFRGFGGPQGMLVIEDILGRCAPLLGLAPEELRRRNLYRPGQSTPYGQPVRHAERLEALWGQVHAEADVSRRQAEVAQFNESHPDRRRGLAVTPVKFGISFNFTPLNQAGALVLVYTDGSVLLTHGGTEMGQGLHTKVSQIAASELGIPLEQVRWAPTRTDKVPNTSATAASSGTDLNGAAVRNACMKIRDRLAGVAAERLGVAAHDIRFADGLVHGLGSDVDPIPFTEVVGLAHLQRIPLSATGFHRTEGLHWDAARMRGEPFKYFVYGVAAAEVEVDGFTGSHVVRRIDVVHDVGQSISPQIDIGQIEGALAQGIGWLTLEDLRWDTSDGRRRGWLTTSSASTYKLPSLGELPDVLNVRLMDNAAEEGAVHGAKAVGEPPLMLAFSVREALRAAVAAFGPPGRSVELPVPSTPEAVYWAVEAARAAVGASG